jgi:hypothetical protein
MRFVWPTNSNSRRSGAPRRVEVALAALCLTVLVGGCEYGYSRSALQGGGPAQAAAPTGSFSVGYQTGWASPWSFGFSYSYPYSPYWYAPYPYYYPYSPFPYDPWWYYPPRYAYPWYPYPYSRAPYVVKPAPKRTFRFEPDSSAPSPSPTPAPSAPSGKSKRRFNFP